MTLRDRIIYLNYHLQVNRSKYKTFKDITASSHEGRFDFQDDLGHLGGRRAGRCGPDRLVRVEVLQEEEAEGQREGQER